MSKVADFDPTHLHSAPPHGVMPVEFRGDLWHQKTRVTRLSCGVVYAILRLAVLVELRLVTDTDRQTDTGPWLVPLCTASRGKNCNRVTVEHSFRYSEFQTADAEHRPGRIAKVVVVEG